MLETALTQALPGDVSSQSAQPFIGQELRPDLSQGAMVGEEDYHNIQKEMQAGSAEAKRYYDTKRSEGLQ
jgi:hypothetical protein